MTATTEAPAKKNFNRIYAPGYKTLWTVWDGGFIRINGEVYTLEYIDPTHFRTRRHGVEDGRAEVYHAMQFCELFMGSGVKIEPVDVAEWVDAKPEDYGMGELPEEADDAATVCAYSDRKSATIIKRTAKTITVRHDKAQLLNGMGSGEADALTCTPGGFCGHVEGVQRYHITSDPYGRVEIYRLRKDGQYHGPSGRLALGFRAPHYDYNF